MAWLTIDFASKRYGVLPSQLLASGDTIDLHCAEIAAGYEKWVKENPGINNKHGLTQDELLEMMENAKDRASRVKEKDA